MSRLAASYMAVSAFFFPCRWSAVFLQPCCHALVSFSLFFFATLVSCPGQFSAFFSSPPVVFWCSGQLFSHFFFALFLISFCSPPPSISTLFPCPAHLVWVEPFYFIYVYCFCSSPFSAIPCLPPPIPVFSLLQHNTHNTHTYTHTQIQP
jgi:hypothetical protein